MAWLAGWTQKLAGYYAVLLATPASARDIDDMSLVEEVDSKLLVSLKPEMTTDSILLATLDLRGMRRPLAPGAGEADWRSTAISRADIDGQGAAFGAAVPLHEFLQAAQAFYVDGSAERVVGHIRDDTRQRNGDRLWFSRQMLRGAALEAKGDRNARGFWKELYAGTDPPLERSTVELALALHDDAHGDPDDVFASGSLIQNTAMRSIVAKHDAGPALLRRLAGSTSISREERALALSTLLGKELTRGSYAAFLTDLDSVPVDGAPSAHSNGDAVSPSVFSSGESAGDIGCPALRTTASRLAAAPGSARDRLCLAEFVRLNRIDELLLDSPAASGSLGSGPSQFPGRPYSRAETYRAVMADADATAQDKAYALFRAVKCYEPSGGNACGGVDARKSERKGWYNELKRQYPASRWAKELAYWW